MCEAPEGPAGRPVPQRQLRFADSEPGSRGVDRHADLATETRGHREAGRASRRRERPLAGERLTGLEASEGGDQASRDELGNAEAAADSLRKGGHVEVDALLKQGRQLAQQVGVAEQKCAGRSGTLRGRQRLSLAAPRQPQHDRARRFGDLGGAVTRTVVRDDDLGVGEPMP
jgi:hypothetical protein